MTTSPMGFRASRAVAARRAGWIAGFFAAGVGLSAAYAWAGVGIACPFRLVTGWDCPFCGATRMGAALLEGDPAHAFRENPLVLVGLVVLGLLGTGWGVEAAGGRRSSSVVLAVLGRIRPRIWTIGAVTLALGFTVLRNLG